MADAEDVYGDKYLSPESFTVCTYPCIGVGATASCSIGLIADPQFVPDHPDSEPMCYTGNVRRYRLVKPLVKEAVDDFNLKGVTAVVQMGDLIDGANAKRSPPTTDTALTAMLNEFSHCSCGGRQVHHLVGNNELRNFSPDELEAAEWIGRAVEMDGSPRSSTLYYSFTVDGLSGWRLVVLNSYCVSLLGAVEGSAATEAAKRYLCARTRLFSQLSPSAPVSAFTAAFPPWPNPAAPADLDRRIAANSGALGDEQLAWLQATLRAAAAAGEKIIIFGHVPVLPAVAHDLDAISWDYLAVLDAIRSPDGRRCVAAYIAGHDHAGGYARDGHDGAHHVTLPSPLEAEPGTGTRFAIASLLDDGGACTAALSPPLPHPALPQMDPSQRHGGGSPPCTPHSTLHATDALGPPRPRFSSTLLSNFRAAIAGQGGPAYRAAQG
jgi:manganese-dependent ADP-ribose/CDP-alcohol diphosphatase